MDAFNAGREKFKLENLSGAKKRLAWEKDGEEANTALFEYEQRGQRGFARSQAATTTRRARMGQLYESAIIKHDNHIAHEEEEALSKTAKIIISL